ncbi:tRNA-guanine transglycosylase [Myriangium duriaei CBS 260.36]|uniref:Queuine tRNA-ribosyltransferase accessory subunit 2 n=1 Tax=Myriangium duriaei CBS 260.36 TaxID=1168546 RepID=A0A9P4J6P3_9PEZI|nr:tRNA-guanine transglycosylase [Myriangium duriaei CBS 260.36]
MFALRAVRSQCSGRLGTLNLPGRALIPTPNYIAITSRGAVPHITQDVYKNSTDIKGVYAAVEDFIEKAPKEIPPVFSYKSPDGSTGLRPFVALPDESTLILGPRRVPPVACPVSNTPTSMAIFTSVGFTQLSTSDYTDAVVKLQPDIVVGMADIPFGAEKYSQKRSEAMTDRTTHWISRQISALTSAVTPQTRPAFFVPILPLPAETQRWYLEDLCGDLHPSLSGLAIYDPSNLPTLPAPLQQLPRLAFTNPATPVDLLRQISLGIDVFTVPFIGAATDAGIALDFRFPAPAHDDAALRPLGIDMWLEEHATDVTPLSEGCTCYACTDHHRAFLRHLLVAKEMLGWVLLQIHNHHVLDEFFAGVRRSVEDGRFDEDVAGFERVYESLLPAKTGQGPRVRGYQYRSQGPGESKRNPAGFKTLDDAAEKVAESAGNNPVNDVKDVEGAGLAEKVE